MDKLHFTVSESTDHTYHRWANEWPPTREQHEMMCVIAEALASGLFYNRDVDAYVLARYDFTEEELTRGKGKVEGGIVGYDIYTARHYLQQGIDAIAEREARERLGIVEGKQLGTLKFGYKKTNHRCVVESMTCQRIIITGTRGGHRWRIDTTARSIERALPGARQ